MPSSTPTHPDQATFSPYHSFTREAWSQLESHPNFPISAIDLSQLHALNEPLTMAEVQEVYLPLCRLLQIHIRHFQNLHEEYGTFLHRGRACNIPFVIGIAGSVAVGKSTTARVLQKLLSMNNETPHVELLTTDGFLYPNSELERRGIFDRKGFPESYDARRLLNFLSAVKSGRTPLLAPTYSHLYYDVQEGEMQLIEQPDVLIVEGINVLQVGQGDGRKRRKVFVSDFFDFSIYVDAEESNIRRWYIERFLKLKETAFQDPNSFFYRYATLSDDEARTLANKIWEEVNLKNLKENILPTRFRSRLILEKSEAHQVRGVRLRKV